MLSFVDHAQFEAAYNCLEAASEDHLDAFETSYGHLSEDDYNAMADAIGFVEEQPLIDCESTLSFTTYRMRMAGLESTWLANGGEVVG